MSSDDEQHNERMDMDNDYEGGQFIGGEYFYGQKREKRKYTKDDALYGVFADSDDEEGGKRGRRGGRGGGGGGGKADFTAPVSFISSGEKQVDEDKPGDGGKGSGRPGLGGGGRGGLGLGASGAGSGAGGLGFTPATTQREESDDDEEVLPTAFGQRLKEQARARQKEERGKVEKKKEQKKLAEKHSDIGAFEKHTKGIGMKLLEKMGYKGGGLGQDGKGMAKPIETKLRPKSMGMGFNDFAEQGVGKKEMQGSDDEEEKKKKAEAAAGGADKGIKTWKKKHRETRVKRVYKTATEVLDATGDEPADAVAKQTIVDMRGPQTRVVTNLEHLNVTSEADDGEPLPMPELQHNLRLIVDLAEADLSNLGRKLRQEKDNTVILGREEERLEEEVRLTGESLARLEELTAAVRKCQESASGAGASSITLEQLATEFGNLRGSYREEYAMYGIGDLALSTVRERMARHFAGWAPLMNPSHGLVEVAAWRRLLEKENVSFGLYPEEEAEGDPYVRLLWDVVLPPLRNAVTNSWEPRSPEPLLVWLEKWEPVLPAAAREHVLDQLVLPKLRSAVDLWEPRSETVPIHAWVHPWLPMLGEKLEPLFPPIKHKLGTALQAWHPSDESALAVLAPWHPVLERKEWDQLLVRCILPKLAFALQELVINPQAQQLEPFQWVMRWHQVVSPHHMATLLDSGFFPKWHQVLWQWLQHSPNYGEITRWYLGWKSQLPEDLQANERVRAQLNAALNMMNQAVEGVSIPAPPSAPGYGGGVAGVYVPPPEQPPLPPLPQQEREMTLKELVERYAEDNSVELLPKVGRIHEGMQVYTFGSVSVVMDSSQQLLKAYIGDQWQVVSLQGVLEEHRRRRG